MEISFRHSDTASVIEKLVTESCSSLNENIPEVLSLVFSGYKGEYHNLEHLKVMLENINFLTPECCQPQVILGVALHDARVDIYGVISRYRQLSKSKAKKTIVDLIKATGHPVKKRLNTHWERVVHDADLAILGYPPPLFNIYEEQVRREYAHVDDRIYYSKRSQIIQSLLQNYGSVERSVYQTEEFREVYHRQSIINIDKALRMYEFESK